MKELGALESYLVHVLREKEDILERLFFFGQCLEIDKTIKEVD
jgi:hypothetical protein